MSDIAEPRSTAGLNKGLRSKIVLALTLGFGLILSAMVALYAAAELWTLDDDVEIVIDLIVEQEAHARTLDLAWPGIDYVYHACCDDSAIIETDIGGRPAKRFVVREDDPLVKGSHRSEIRLRPNGLGDEVWYRAAIHIADDWQPSDVRVTAMQWHGTRDIVLMEIGRTPPLQLGIRGDHWEILKSWDKRWISTREQDEKASDYGRTLLTKAPVARGQWQEWTFYLRWSAGDDGILKVWLDDELVLDDRGPNAHQDLIGPYMKVGVYVPDWTLYGPEPTITERALSFDKLIMSGARDPFSLD